GASGTSGVAVAASSTAAAGGASTTSRNSASPSGSASTAAAATGRPSASVRYRARNSFIADSPRIVSALRATRSTRRADHSVVSTATSAGGIGVVGGGVVASEPCPASGTTNIGSASGPTTRYVPIGVVNTPGSI